MSNGSDQEFQADDHLLTNLQPDGPGGEGVCWRAWPCDSCSPGATPIGFLFNRQETGGEIPKGHWNEIVGPITDREVSALQEWVQSCSHNEGACIRLPQVAEGSEHLVFLDSTAGEVTKVTRVNCYGEFYTFADGRVTQWQCTPLQYLIRMRLWKKLFGNEPRPLGITHQGQIVTVQKFITGEPPTQTQVNDYLRDIGFTAVRESCWLWKRDFNQHIDAWLGDARDENFVLSEGAIVPIDIRLWGETIG